MLDKEMGSSFVFTSGSFTMSLMSMVVCRVLCFLGLICSVILPHVISLYVYVINSKNK